MKSQGFGGGPIRESARRFARLIPLSAVDELIRWGHAAKHPERRRALEAAEFVLRQRSCDIDVELPGGSTAYGRSDEIVIRYLKVFCTWEPLVAQRLLEALTKDSVFLDVGANRGYYASLATTRLSGQGRVIAVEALPSHIDALQSIADHAAQRVPMDVVQAAMSDSIGFADFYLPSDDNLGRGSLVHEMATSGETVRVPTVTLDEMCRSLEIDPSQIGAIKIDVEGAEVAVLEGGQDVLSQLRPGAIVLLEVADAGIDTEIRVRMSAMGFSEERLENEYTPAWYAQKVVGSSERGVHELDYPRDYCFMRLSTADRT